MLLKGNRGSDDIIWGGKIVQGHWWHAFGIFLSSALLAAYGYLILAVLIIILTLLFGDQTGAEAILWFVCLAVPMSFLAIVKVVLYYDLRLRQANPDPIRGSAVAP